MLDAWQDEVRPVDAPLDGTVIPHLQLEASPAAPEPALTGAPGHQLNDLPDSPGPAQARTTHAGPDPR
jgi:hypothetical protein